MTEIKDWYMYSRIANKINDVMPTGANVINVFHEKVLKGNYGFNHIVVVYRFRNETFRARLKSYYTLKELLRS